MIQPTLTIARFTLLEAIRNRLFTMMLVGLICILGLTEFVGELAITETKQIQSVMIGSVLRVFTIFIVSLFIITSMVREFNDKGFEVMLSLSLPRYSYYFGKFIGFTFLAFIIAIAASLLLLLYSPAFYILPWLISLCCELLIVISLSILCLFTFSNITIAFATVFAFYILSRSMNVIQLISDSPILDFRTFSQTFINTIIDAIAYVLPELNEFTQSDWLIYGSGFDNIAPILFQTVIYLSLLSAAGLFDLYRKDF